MRFLTQARSDFQEQNAVGWRSILTVAGLIGNGKYLDFGGDNDLGIRAGWTIWREPAARVLHHGSGAFDVGTMRRPAWRLDRHRRQSVPKLIS